MVTTTPTQDDKLERLKQAKAYAISKGGLCLSEEYINAVHKMQWKCSNPEHPVWETKFNNMVKNGAWCKKCAAENCSINTRNPEGLKIAKKYAIKRGGLCLSETYETSNTQMEWKCSNPKHPTWKAKFTHVVNRNNWCKYCGQMQFEDGLKVAQTHAIKKGGFCVSEKYNGSREKLMWKCNNTLHNPWQSSFDSVVNHDTWCPQCSINNNFSEKRSRMILETYFGFELNTSRPKWNINPLTNKKLELDGYNEEHKIAFEHDGEHHFEESRFGTNLKDKGLEYQKFKDQTKKDNCLNNGITLINIPILPGHKRKKFFKFLRHIIACCKNQNIILTFTLQQIRDMKYKFHKI